MLRGAKNKYVLDAPPSGVVVKTTYEREAHTLRSDEAVSIQCLMLTCMGHELQKRLDRISAEQHNRRTHSHVPDSSKD